MAAQRAARGRLIAVDGSHGPAVAAAAKRLARAHRDANGGGGVSLWDSSGIFTELAAAEPGVAGPSARTFILLYAADLAFRQRWQIGPAIEAGHTVVAAPYVESAKALGSAAGLSRRWLKELFRFASKPDICYYVKERGGPVNRGTRADYAERLWRVLRAGGDPGASEAFRTRTVDYFKSLERRGRSIHVDADAVAAPRRAVARR
ncbi:MAG: hypothetical protein ACRD3C_22825 [Vicinamibacterales bacterium]